MSSETSTGTPASSSARARRTTRALALRLSSPSVTAGEGRTARAAWAAGHQGHDEGVAAATGVRALDHRLGLRALDRHDDDVDRHEAGGVARREHDVVARLGQGPAQRRTDGLFAPRIAIRIGLTPVLTRSTQTGKPRTTRGGSGDGRARPQGGRMIELLIADVDGTLVTHDKELTERARQAVRKLRDARIGFAITSGRPPRGMSMLVEPLAITTPIAGFNGGMFVQPDMTPIEVKALPVGHRAAGRAPHRRGRPRRVGLPGERLVRAQGRRAARGARAVDGALRADGGDDLARLTRGRGQDRRRERRPRGGGGVRARPARAIRRPRVGGPLAAVLRRRDPPQREQGRRGARTCRRSSASPPRTSPRSATCPTTSSCSRAAA